MALFFVGIALDVTQILVFVFFGHFCGVTSSNKVASMAGTFVFVFFGNIGLR